MNLPLLILVAFITHQTLSCRELFHNKTRVGGYNFRYDYSKGRYTSYDTTVNNCTIVCSNIYSISEIFYVYKERTYDQFLKITDSNITTLHSNELISFPTIMKLYLSGIHIERILPGAFTGLLRLEELYLDDNELSEISKGVFTSLQKLTVLDLSSNRIVQIEKFALMGVSNLKTLYLFGNNISRLEDDIFDKLNRLTYLDLSENPLERLPTKGLSNLDYLILKHTSLDTFDYLGGQNWTMRVLNLTWSQITSVDFAKFPKFTNDVSLDLSNNQISSVENCDVLDDSLIVNLMNNRIRFIECGFRKLSRLNLENNQLERINSSLLKQSKSVWLVNLGDNNISTIDVDAFRNLTELSVLGLYRNNISKIDPSLFQNLTSLYYLSLSYNRITEFQYGTFSNLKSLLILDISYNRLLNLHPYNFYSLRNLRYLYFDYNNVSSFDVKDLTSHLNSIMSISLNGNPWRCKQLIQMSHDLRNMSVVIKEGTSFDVENFNGIACQNDNHVPENTDLTALMKQFQMLLNETLMNEQNFFNRDFEKSNFVKFFKENYNQSNFFKYYTNVEKNASSEVASEPVQAAIKSKEIERGGNNGILVLSVVLQFVICALLVFIAYFMFSFMRKGHEKKGMDRVSQVELCSDY